MNNERGIDVRIAICEDNRQDAEALEGLLAEQRDRFPNGLQIERFPSGEALIAAYQSGERFELILLDIYMAEMSGVDAARTLRLLDPEAQLAFLTTSPDFALEAIGLEALHYLVKPVTRQKLDELLRRFFKRVSRPVRVLELSVRRETRRFSLERLWQVTSQEKGIALKLERTGELWLPCPFRLAEEQLRSETEFAPEGAMTRGMLVTVLYRLEGEPSAGSAAFSDVPADSWFAKAVAWASESGVVNGVGDGKFAPDDRITREQLATMLQRYAAYLSLSGESGTLDGFADADRVSDWAREAMQFAVANGIIGGKDHNLLDPRGNATRAEVATMLRRFVSLTLQ